MREIGGYIEFEQFHKEMLHESAIKLNCGRNCLAYLIKMRGITSIALPYFLCESVKNICKKYSYKAKVFTQVPSDFKSKIGSPDLVVLFTSTVSHSMVRCAIKEAQRKNVEVIRSHTSSANALTSILEEHAERAVG